MKFSKVLLPFLVASFCYGLNACTDDSDSSDIVLQGSNIVRINMSNCEMFFDISIKRETFSSDNPTAYVFKILAEAKHCSVHKTVSINVEVMCHYKLEANTNTVHYETQDCEISLPHNTNKMYSSTYTFTFDKPIEEYPYFKTDHSIKSASGEVLRNN